MNLATIDWVIIGVMAVSTLLSLRRGFVKEALSLLTWIAAVLIARLFAAQFTVVLEPYIETSSVRLGAAYLLLFMATLMLGGLVNHLLSEFVRVTGLSGLDRLLGMLFGFARGAVIVVVFVALLHYVAPVKQDTWYQESRLIPEAVMWIEKLGPALWEQGEQWLQSGEEAAQSTVQNT